jgi:hypothetical protein
MTTRPSIISRPSNQEPIDVTKISQTEPKVENKVYNDIDNMLSYVIHHL